MGNCCKVCDTEKLRLLKLETQKAERQKREREEIEVLELKAADAGICPNCVRPGLRPAGFFSMLDYKCPFCGWKGDGWRSYTMW